MRFERLRRRAVAAGVAVLITSPVTPVFAAGNAPAAISPAAVVRSVAPNTGTVGGGRSVTVTGTGFSHVTRVVFGTTAARGVHVVNSGRLTAVTPAHTAGVVDVRVMTRVGGRDHLSGVIATDRYSYVAPPSVATLSPDTSPAAGGRTVTLSGSGFTTMSSVSFGTAKAPAVRVASSTRLTVTAPPHAPGVVDVRVTSSYGTSPVTSAGRFTYRDTTPPPPVTSVSVGSPTGSSLTLTWTAPSTTDYAGAVVRRPTGPVAPVSPTDGDAVADVPAPQQSVLDPGLAPETTYSYAVFAHDPAGNLAAAATGSATTSTAPDTTAPGSVQNLIAAAGAESVGLTWTPPTDPDFTGVTIRRSDRPSFPAYGIRDGDPVAELGPDATSYVDTGLVPGVHYAYSLFTHDAVGNYSRAVIASATPSCTYRDVAHVSGTLTRDTTWSSGCAGTYVIDRPGLNVPTGITLTVAPGTVVKAAGAGLTVIGTLNAVGTADSPITFTSLDDDSVVSALGDGAPVAGDWTGISAGEQPPPDSHRLPAKVDLEFASIRYATSPVATNNTWLTVTDSTISDAVNEGIAALDNSDYGPVLRNDTIDRTATRPAQAAVYLTVRFELDEIRGLHGSGNGLNATMLDGGASGEGSYVLESTPSWPVVVGRDGPCGYPGFCTGSFGSGPGRTIHIPAGSVVKFVTSSRLGGSGSLDAVGSDSSPIVFTSINDDTVGGATGSRPPRPGDWNGVDVSNGLGQSGATGVFDHVQVRYARFGISSYEAAASITNSTISDNTADAISVVSYQVRPPTITDNVIDRSATDPLSKAISVDGNVNLDQIVRNRGTGNGHGATYLSGVVVTRSTLHTSPDWPVVIGTTTGCTRRTPTPCSIGDGLNLGYPTTIPAGSVVKFLYNTYLGGYSNLTAIGTADAPIVLTSIDDNSVGAAMGTGSPAAQDWGGLSFGPFSEPPTPYPTVDLSYVDIGFAGAGVQGNRVDLRMRHCVIHDVSGTAISASNLPVAPVVTDNTVERAATVAGTVPLDLSGQLDPSHITGNRTRDDGSEVTRLEGTLVADGTLDPASGRPVVVSTAFGTLTVSTGATVTVPAGGVLKFATRAGLVVNGSLRAAGTTDAPITFTSVDDDSVGGPTGSGSMPPRVWAGITAAGNVNLDHTTLAYAVTALTVSGSRDSSSVHHTWFHHNYLALGYADPPAAPSGCAAPAPFQAQDNEFGPDRSAAPFMTRQDRDAVQRALAAGATTSPDGWTDRLATGDSDLIGYRLLTCAGGRVLTVQWRYF